MVFDALLSLICVTALGADTAPASAPVGGPVVCSKDTGYRGIWYANQALDSEYRYKYSGGLGTYCADHIPMAYYSPEAQKTFFVYGGMPVNGHTSKEKRTLLIMVSYYDHKTGLVPRPTLLMDKKTSDAHDNPTIMLDGEGYVWVFVAAHGTSRPAYIYKSAKPYEIDAFRLMVETNFSYPQPWYVQGKGFLFLHTRYREGHRELFWMTSPDGVAWSEPRPLAAIENGHYQISWRHEGKIGTAFNYHPTEGGLNARTNLYYLESKDFGQTWRTAGGKPAELPLKGVQNEALVFDYARLKRLVYLCDLTFDRRGNPIILYVTSRGFEPGPQNDPRIWTTARWTGREWEVTGNIRSDSNYDMGSLYYEKVDRWRLIAPTRAGPQPYNPGGEVLAWTSDDQGRSWWPQPLTAGSRFNHTYMRRPVNAHREFYAFWADGDGRQPSESRLYFADADGNVFRLPEVMETDFARPEPLPRLADSKFPYEEPAAPASKPATPKSKPK